MFVLINDNSQGVDTYWGYVLNFKYNFTLAVSVSRAYHVHKKLFTSKLISRNVKLQLYNMLIRPTVTYTSKTRVLKESMINKLMIFKRKIMRKILGPTRSDNGYRRLKPIKKSMTY